MKWKDINLSEELICIEEEWKSKELSWFFLFWKRKGDDIWYLKKSILENIDKFKNNESEWDEKLRGLKEVEEKFNYGYYDYKY